MSLFQFDTTYRFLPEVFYEKGDIPDIPEPYLSIFNQNLAKELGLETTDLSVAQLTDLLLGKSNSKSEVPLAQAYAGHQFGHFNMLGDGRALLLGEHINKRFRRDVQLKGSGRTAYSRRGDGKATYKSMLREYLMSEALHGLQIPSTRSLAVITTGEKVQRDYIQDGAILVRIAKSHIRVGTFEYANVYIDFESLQKLADYTISRHDRDLMDAKQKYDRFFKRVISRQIDLIVDWMRVGFIHGVMNTDNMSIAGETIDYGPCSFMGIYHPKTVYSSIDTMGRYAYQNQPAIAKYNLSILASALWPLLEKENPNAKSDILASLAEFDLSYTQKWYQMMFAKIGFPKVVVDEKILIDDLLKILEKEKIDYTGFFKAISSFDTDLPVLENENIQNWIERWQSTLAKHTTKKEAKVLMQRVNPQLVPYNYWVEKALAEAENGDFNFFDQLLMRFENPYDSTIQMEDLPDIPENFDQSYQTFCGT